MLRKFALWGGIILTAIGLLGWVPGITTTDENGMELLMGLFMVDSVHNIVHILSGLAAVAASRVSDKASRLFFQGFGIVYGLVAVIGFIQGDTVLGLFHVNMADNFLHVFFTAVGLYLGFVYKQRNA